MTRADARHGAARNTGRRLRPRAARTGEPAPPAWDNTEALLAVASLHGDDDLDGDVDRGPPENGFGSVTARRDGTIGPGGGSRPALSGTGRGPDREGRPGSEVRPGPAGRTDRQEGTS